MPRPAERPPLSQQRIVETAAQLVDARGWEALSLRGVAAALQVTPMALYRHVSGIEDLRDLVVEAYLLEQGSLPEHMDWNALLRAVAVRTREVMLRHPAIYDAVRRRAVTTESGMLGFENLLSAAKAAGIGPAAAIRAYSVVLLHVMGHVALVHGRRAALAAEGRSEQDERGRVESVIRALDPERFPLLSAAASEVAGSLDDDAFFKGLDLLLAALSRDAVPPGP